MFHKPIHIDNLSLSFPHKTCFEDFSATIYPGQKIAVIGRNGSGKSSLLKMLSELIQGSTYVPQIITGSEDLSGGQKLISAISCAIVQNPKLLLLDEPTNHLDTNNRRILVRLLRSFDGTLIMVTYDIKFLQEFCDIIWNITDGKIDIFDGNYDNYIREKEIKRINLSKKIDELNKEKMHLHHDLMQEQSRASKSKSNGQKSIENRKWPTIVSKSKADKAANTTGKKKSAIDTKKDNITSQLSELIVQETLKPKFSITAANISDKTILSLNNVDIFYDQPLIKNLSFTLGAKEKLAIKGNNGSGKSTIVKAILNYPGINKSGEFYTPKAEDIGYLDQHYNNLCDDHTVIETIENIRFDWNYMDNRKHLNDFLFRKNDEVNCKVRDLSGGERARLSLAVIAAKTPRLLILDEITNNLDLETKHYVADILKAYPGALLIISHDEKFLEEIEVKNSIVIERFLG